MKLRKAMEMSIRNFYNGNLPEGAIEASELEFEYTPEFFQRMKDQDINDEEIADEAAED